MLSRVRPRRSAISRGHQIIWLDPSNARIVDRFDGGNRGSDGVNQSWRCAVEVPVRDAIDVAEGRIIASRLEQFIEVRFDITVENQREAVLRHSLNPSSGVDRQSAC